MRRGIRAEAVREIHLAYPPASLAVPMLDGDRHGSPLASPTAVSAEQDRIPLQRFQYGREDGGCMA